MINLDQLAEYPVVAMDVETTGLYWYRDSLFGAAIAVLDGEKVESGYWDVREKPRILELLRDQIPKCKKLVNHHIKFDAHFGLNAKIKMPLDRIECTMVRAALINEHEPSFSLDALSKKHLGEGKAEIWNELSTLFGGAPTRAAQIKNLGRAPSTLAARYAAPDPALALKLWLWQEQEIERQELQRIWALERALTPILVQIERQGVRVDEELARRSATKVQLVVDEAQRKLNKIAGKEVNSNSPKQMQELFKPQKHEIGGGRFVWRSLDGTPLETTEAGSPSIDKDALIAMSAKVPAASHVLTIRKMLKCQSFLNDHILGHAVKGRVFPNYNQAKGESGLGTGTGRFSINDPALQQIPMHDRDVAEIVRPCFLPEQGQVWACADWKQFEFRWFAHYVNDATINKMYQENPDADFHQTTADITGITRDKKYAGDTANAKQINLGLVFGMGEGEMAYNMGMEYETRVDDSGRMWKTAGDKAKAVFKKYHDAIPGVKALLQQASSIARSRGYVQTIMGRHIRFPGGKFTHKAAGLVFQGSSADCMKQKMIEVWPMCKKEGWTYMLTVHDEHDLSVPRTKATKSAYQKMASVFENFDGVCRIPIRSDINFGKNWWEACK